MRLLAVVAAALTIVPLASAAKPLTWSPHTPLLRPSVANGSMTVVARLQGSYALSCVLGDGGQVYNLGGSLYPSVGKRVTVVLPILTGGVELPAPVKCWLRSGDLFNDSPAVLPDGSVAAFSGVLRSTG